MARIRNTFLAECYDQQDYLQGRHHSCKYFGGRVCWSLLEAQRLPWLLPRGKYHDSRQRREHHHCRVAHYSHGLFACCQFCSHLRLQALCKAWDGARHWILGQFCCQLVHCCQLNLDEWELSNWWMICFILINLSAVSQTLTRWTSFIRLICMIFNKS